MVACEQNQSKISGNHGQITTMSIEMEPLLEMVGLWLSNRSTHEKEHIDNIDCVCHGFF